MTKTAFSKIVDGLEDAIAYAKGDVSRGTAKLVMPIDVKGIRLATGKTQKVFAERYRLPVATVRDWEQQRRQPDAPARVLLGMIEADPEAVAMLAERVKMPAIG